MAVCGVDDALLFRAAKALVAACEATDSESAKFSISNGWLIEIRRWEESTKVSEDLRVLASKLTRDWFTMARPLFAEVHSVLVGVYDQGVNDVIRRGANDPARPDDIRALGWSLIIHSDCIVKGRPGTSWLFTKDGRAVCGEGYTDTEALDRVREHIKST